MKNPLSSSYLTYSKTIKLGFNKVSFRIQIQQTKPNMLTWFCRFKMYWKWEIKPERVHQTCTTGK